MTEGIGVMNYTDICECGNLLDVDSGRPYWSWSFCIPFTHIEICFWNWAKPDYVDECSECLIEKQRQHEDWISGSAAQVGYERGLEDGRRE